MNQPPVEPVAESQLDSTVERIRSFNRAHTLRLGALAEALLPEAAAQGVAVSLVEARVLYELAQWNDGARTAGASPLLGQTTPPSAAALCERLGLDPAQTSRVLAGFKRRRWLHRSADPTDARRTRLRLTPEGERAFAVLNAASAAQVAGWLQALPSAEQTRLAQALDVANDLLSRAAAPMAEASPAPAPAPDAADEAPLNPYAGVPIVPRTHRPGDVGWVIHRHGALYAREYGWAQSFEGMVAQIGADFIDQFDPQRERCWLAEAHMPDGTRPILGSVTLVKKSAATARLRLLYVEPAARGLGVGKRLVAECEAFAKAAGYRKITLWTNSILHAARGIYEERGYKLVASEAHESYGQSLVGETWEKRL